MIPLANKQNKFAFFLEYLFRDEEKVNIEAEEPKTEVNSSFEYLKYLFVSVLPQIH